MIFFSWTQIQRNMNNINFEGIVYEAAQPPPPPGHIMTPPQTQRIPGHFNAQQPSQTQRTPPQQREFLMSPQNAAAAAAAATNSNSVMTSPGIPLPSSRDIRPVTKFRDHSFLHLVSLLIASVCFCFFMSFMLKGLGLKQSKYRKVSH